MAKLPPKEFNPEASMWKVSLFILVAGGLIAYALSFNKIDMGAQKAFRLTIVFTIVLSGICAIAASARRWNRR